MVKYKTYQRALKHEKRAWAKRVIEQWGKQSEKNGIIKEYRTKNLKDITPAESKFKDILDAMQINYVREQTIRRGKDFYFIDFFLPQPLFLAFEIDGGIHKKRQVYDFNRDMKIMSRDNIAVVRYTNEQVLFKTEWVRANVERIVKEKWESYVRATH